MTQHGIPLLVFRPAPRSPFRPTAPSRRASAGSGTPRPGEAHEVASGGLGSLAGQGHLTRRRGRPGADEARPFAPPFDVREGSEAFVIQADVPGLRPDDLTLQLERGVLTLSGERRRTEVDTADAFRLAERPHGGFERQVHLPGNVDADGIQASVEAGVVTIRVPKRPQDRPRSIPVRQR